MAFEDLLASLNSACLSVFGTTSLTFSRVTSLPEDEESDEFSIAGIIEPGADPEQQAPGDGSTYARLFIDVNTILPSAQNGDEITAGTTVYKIVQIQEDGGEGVLYLLRKDRAVTA
jgi:hypothetical protein